MTLTNLEICNLALNKIGQMQSEAALVGMGMGENKLFKYLAKRRKTMKDKTIIIKRTSNGFITDQEAFERDTGEAIHISHSFENFDSLAEFLRGNIDNKSSGWERMRKMYNVDTCEPEQTPGQMRDELGELRRFRERAEKRGAEQNETIKNLTAQCADYRERWHDAIGQLSDKNKECEASEELAGILHKELADLKIKKRKLSRRKA